MKLFRPWGKRFPRLKFEKVVSVYLEKAWNNFKYEWLIFVSVRKWYFTFVSIV